MRAIQGRRGSALTSPVERRDRPVGAPGSRLLDLQRSAGNRAVCAVLDSGGQPTVLRRKTDKAKAKTSLDFDNTQYRVSGPADNRKVEAVRRAERDGTPYYEATGLVTGFTATRLPVVQAYDKPVDLGNWSPTVTHLNGMAVRPESGMTSANALLDSVQATIKQAGGDVALDQSAIDVLYTYSANRGFLGDLWNCIKGKARAEDGVTRNQEQTMLDAVAAKKRLHVSAHSRGTIKTDNAVRTVFKVLVRQYTDTERDKAPVKKDARQRAKELEQTGLFDAGTAYQLALQQCAEHSAARLARANMDRYIQLVYGGNAVQYPSSVLPVELFVGKGDFVSMFVGTYTDRGAKLASGNDRSTLHKQSGGHGYTPNYARPVGQAIAGDLLKTTAGAGQQ